jgi:hypothetical protein
VGESQGRWREGANQSSGNLQRKVLLVQTETLELSLMSLVMRQSPIGHTNTKFWRKTVVHSVL